MQKHCIFHIPYELNLKWPSASQIRPLKMIEAFKKIGYKVDIVMGYGCERKDKIKEIKDKIKNGTKYDFVYSESSTEPTLLTERNHIPKYPFLDFKFFKYCKKNGIKIGLFYRDIHWRFDQYKNNVSFIKRIIAYAFYKYDLKKYNSLIDIMYLPCTLMSKYIPIFNGNVEPLPPATDKEENANFDDLNSKLHIFYVGGVNKELYNLEKLISVVSKNEFLKLTLCCREKEWEATKEIYNKYLNERITIVHANGEDLIPYFRKAHILNLFVEPTKYWEFAMPVKLFDYLSYKKPIVGVTNTAAGSFIDENNIGWSIKYDEKRLLELLQHIDKNRELILQKGKNVDSIIDANKWTARAKKVAKDLSL